MKIASRFQALWQPIPKDKRELLRQRWHELPTELQKPWQVVGRQMTQCGYTLGPAYCSFGCSHCYLPANVNRAPLPTLEEMKEQIDANRRLLGHGGNLQITGGDVIDAYFRAGKPDELVEVVRYAGLAGVVPMVMTHGQKLLEHPDFLDRLVLEGGLRKLAIHIDVTQAGRPGFPKREIRSEAELHPLRQAFVDLILDCRRRTGVRFSAAHTLTITEQNLDQVGEVLTWLTAHPDRLQAFRMVSFQPGAQVGRTRAHGAGRPATPEACWGEIESFIGSTAGRDNLWFGDPECSHMTTLLVLFPEGRILDAIPPDERTRELWGRIYDVFGGVGGRGADHLDANLRRFALWVRRPGILAQVISYLRYRSRQEGLGLTRLVARAARGQVGALNIVQHNFMDEADVQSDDPQVQRRLQACAFRGAVKDGESWKAVPMCSINSGDRAQIYAQQIESLSPQRSDSG